MNYTKEFCEKVYNEFISDENCIGIASVGRKFGLSKCQCKKLCDRMKRFYKGDELEKIYRRRQSKYMRSKRTNRTVSDAQRRKVSASNKIYWQNVGEAQREISRQSMIKYCSPHCQSPEARKKRIESRKRNNPIWHTKEARRKIGDSKLGKKLTAEHRQKIKMSTQNRRVGWHNNDAVPAVFQSEEYKQKRREILLNHWAKGTFKPKYKSKGQLEVIDILKSFGYEIEDEFIIEGKPYDVYISNTKILIEFNGTYWHRDPRFYTKDGSNVENVWKRDGEKKNIAEKNGYKIYYVWQYDWEKYSYDDKLNTLKGILNG